jgi:hypothetical protein
MPSNWYLYYNENGKVLAVSPKKLQEMLYNPFLLIDPETADKLNKNRKLLRKASINQISGVPYLSLPENVTESVKKKLVTQQSIGMTVWNDYRSGKDTAPIVIERFGADVIVRNENFAVSPDEMHVLYLCEKGFWTLPLSTCAIPPLGGETYMKSFGADNIDIICYTLPYNKIFLNPSPAIVEYTTPEDTICNIWNIWNTGGKDTAVQLEQIGSNLRIKNFGCEQNNVTFYLCRKGYMTVPIGSATLPSIGAQKTIKGKGYTLFDVVCHKLEYNEVSFKVVE